MPSNSVYDLQRGQEDIYWAADMRRHDLDLLELGHALPADGEERAVE